jgi:hypothetical protein
MATAAITFSWARRAGAKAVGAFKLQRLRLYQTEDIVAARVDVDSLANSAKAIQQAFERLTAGAWLPEVKGVVVAVAIRPGRRQRIWCELVGKNAPRDAVKLDTELAKTTTPDVKGLVAYALEFAREGQKPTLPIVPKSWQAVAKQAGREILIPDDAVAALWPEAAQPGLAPDAGSPSPPARR